MASEKQNVTVLEDVLLVQLRKQIQDLQSENKTLLEAYQFNERSYSVVSKMAIETSACETLSEMDDVICNSLVQEAGGRACLYLINPSSPIIGFRGIKSVSTLTDDARQMLEQLTSTQSEPCREETYNTYLEGLSDTVGSIVWIPINHRELQGVLTIGSPDNEFFRPDHGTVFLDFLGSLTAITVERCLKKHEQILVE